MDLFTPMHAQPVKDITALNLLKQLSSGNKPILLDASEPVGFRSGHIAGAQSIPLAELRKWLHEVPQGVEVVCICATGQRSVPVIRTLAAAGYTASHLKNGMISWQMVRRSVMKDLSE